MGILCDGIEVRALYNAKRVQMLEFDHVHAFQYTNKEVYLLAGTTLHRLSAIPPCDLVDLYVLHGQYQDALDFLDSLHPLVGETLQQTRRSIQKSLGLAWIEAGERYKGVEALIQLSLDPAEILSFLPSIPEDLEDPSLEPDLALCQLFLSYITELRARLHSNELIDTALFKIYMLIRPSLVGSLLRLPNRVNHTDAVSLLTKYRKWPELLDFYHQRSLDPVAITLILDQQMGSRVLAEYLGRLDENQLPLLFQYASLILNEDQETFLAIFMRDALYGSCREILQYLSQYPPDLPVRYCTWLIEEKKSLDPVVHQRLLGLYFERMLRVGGTDDSFMKFLCISPVIDVKPFLERLPEDSLYYIPRAYLLGRLKRHNDAIRLLEENGEPEGAIER